LRESTSLGLKTGAAEIGGFPYPEKVIQDPIRSALGGFLPGFLLIDQIIISGEAIFVRAMTNGRNASCPTCARESERVHSRYFRKLGDAPWYGNVVRLEVKVRRFFCVNSDCARQTFAERLSELAQRHSRTTKRLAQAHCQIGFALGGEAGARLATRLAMPTSPDTLLRRVRQAHLPVPPPVRVLGVDDWALRKGQRYGTILCDLERRRPVDLLPERSASVLRDWLQNHPEVEIISRDRGDEYIKGASEGAPQAIQVADRWHLLKNLRESLERVVNRYQGRVRDAARATISLTDSSPEPAQGPDLNRPSTKYQERQQQRRARRLARFDQVRDLHQRGVSLRTIAHQLGMHRGTVRRFVRAETFPERASRPSYRKTDAWTECLRRRWEEGCHNAARLTEELRAQGFPGSYYMVLRRVATWRRNRSTTSLSQLPASKKGRIPARPSSRSVSWLLLKKEQDLHAEERTFLEEIGKHSPPLRNAAALAREFATMVQDQRPDDWLHWKTRASDPAAATELRSFAQSLETDEKAVRAALATEWSNGQVEGHVNRLKTIKRQMYGRANFDLLRQRVLCAA
jgi:transposase